MKKVKAEQLRKLLKKKDKMITLRMNPELLRLLDEALEKDREYQSRNELIESLILRYLESKGKI
jgi:metal-responsive CopG/Arc/MetJ family transcriptional regulator